MSLLEEFIFSLSKAERQQLRPLQFRGVKRKIMLRFLKHREGKIDHRILLRSYKLTRHRYNQLLSEILTGCYRDVAPNGGVTLLQFLGNKQLFRHLYQEMRKQEAKHLLSSPQDLETYYLKTMIASHSFMLSRSNMKLIKEGQDYYNRYLRVKSQRNAFDNSYVEIEAIETAIVKYTTASVVYDRVKIARHLNQLDQLWQKLRGQNTMLEFDILLRLQRHSLRLLQDREKSEYYFIETKNLLKSHPTLFGEIQWLFEFEYYSEVARHKGNEIEPVLAFYHRSAKHLTAGFPLSNLYFFFAVVLMSQDFALARKLIHLHFPVNPDLLAKQVAVYYWEMLMRYHIYAHEWEEGKQALEKALQANTRKHRNVRKEILLRQCAVFFTALNGDPVATEEHVARDKRYSLRYGYRDVMYLTTIAELMKCVGIDPERALAIKEAYLTSVSFKSHLYLMVEVIYRRYFGQSLKRNV